MKRMQERLKLTAMAAVALQMIEPAVAQLEEERADAATAGDEVIVTARRRDERLQDVPVSITAKSGEQLRREGVTNIIDLGKVAPSLTVSQSPRGSNTPNFTMRGQRVIDTSMVLDPVVVTYFNEVPFMRPQGLNAALFDVKSVEVLRGPQGALFGRNTTGGAVLITTNEPTSEFEGDFEITGGNYGLIEFSGAVNIPLGPRAALRIAGVAREREGYMRERATGFRANDEDYDAARISLRLEPRDNIVNTTYVGYFSSSDNGSAQQIYAVNPAISSASFQAALPTLLDEIALNKADPWTYNNNNLGSETAETFDVSNVTVIDLGGGLTLKNVVGYRTIETLSAWDIDGSSVYLLRFHGESDIEQFSEELQLQGDHGPFEWILGLYYFNEDGGDVATSFLPSSPTTPRPSGVFATNTSYSVFASGAYEFGDSGVSVNAGIRYTHDERKSAGLQMTGDACTFRFLDGSLIDPPCLFEQEISFDEPSWLVSVDYKAADGLLLYAAHRHGYRSGGLQSRATTEAAAIPFNPEKVNDIELGVKWDFAFGGVRGSMNADVYQAWYQDIQRQVSFISPTSGTLVSSIFNAAQSHIRGAELEFTLHPGVEGLTLSAGYGYSDPQYDEFINNGVDVADITPFGYISQHTLNAQASYATDLGPDVGEFVATFSYRYQSEYYNADVVVPVAGWVPGWDLANIRLDLNEVGGTRLGLSAFVNNLFDEAYFPFSTNLTASTGYANRHVGAPRMYGVSARVSF